MLDWFISFLSLSLMEIVLGIDNIIFISILTKRIEERLQDKARITGLVLALGVRIVLLIGVKWLIGFNNPLFTLDLTVLGGHPIEITGTSLIFIAGGLFLIYKSTTEIHHKLEGRVEDGEGSKKSSFTSVIIQIILLDIVFSFDSILTAIGLVEHINIMIAAVVLAMIIMLFASKPIGAFIHKHPTIKMLALSFLLMIGFMLLLEGFHHEVPKGYIYACIFFSLIVEVLNIKMRKNAKKSVDLHSKYKDESLSH